MKYTIEDLRNGKCAVKNDGTLEELDKVLRKAFPEDIERLCYIGSPDRIYCCHRKKHNSNQWIQCYEWEKIDLPTQSVKDFLSFSPKRGDVVLVRNREGQEWKPLVLASEIKGAIFSIACVVSGHEDKFNNGEEFAVMLWKQMKPLEQPEEMTLKEVCKELGRDIKIVKE